MKIKRIKCFICNFIKLLVKINLSTMDLDEELLLIIQLKNF